MLKNTVLIFASMLFATNATFSTPVKDNPFSVVNKGEVFEVIYKGTTPAMVNITISDVDGNNLYNERIFGSRFSRPYNLSHLPKGSYVISIKDENETHIETISYREKTWDADISKVRGYDDRYIVTVPLNRDGDTSVSIYNSDHQLMFTELDIKDRDFARVYHLKNMEGGVINVSNRSTGEVKSLEIK